MNVPQIFNYLYDLSILFVGILQTLTPVITDPSYYLEEADHIWAVRTPEYKYLNQTLPGVGKSFFDMQADPYEANNLYGKEPELQAQLAALWNEWNSHNKQNVLLQAEPYKKRRDEFYDELYQQLQQKAQERKPYTVE